MEPDLQEPETTPEETEPTVPEETGTGDGTDTDTDLGE